MRTNVLGKIALSSITGTSLHLTTEEVGELHGFLENLRSIVRHAQPFLKRLAALTNDRNDFISITTVDNHATEALKEGT